LEKNGVLENTVFLHAFAVRIAIKGYFFMTSSGGPGGEANVKCKTVSIFHPSLNRKYVISPANLCEIKK
jgi:hypothetical protein